MSPPPLLSPCAACGSSRPGPFCPACGQEVKKEAPVTVRSIGQELVRGLNPVKRTAWRTLRAMPSGPGTVALAYVRGKRKPYSHPFSFFGLSVLYLSLTSAIYRPILEQAVAAEAAASAPGASAMASAMAERRDALDFFLANQEGYGLLLALPLAVALAWLVGRHRLPEWLVAVLYSLALVNLVLGIAKPVAYTALPFEAASLAVLVVWIAAVLAVVLMAVRDFVPPFRGRMLRAALAVAVALGGYAVLSFVVNVGYWIVTLL